MQCKKHGDVAYGVGVMQCTIEKEELEPSTVGDSDR